MNDGYEQYKGKWEANAQLAWDTLAFKATRGIPNNMLHVMDWGMLEEVAGFQPGDYEKNPEKVYLAFQKKIGTCTCDQWIPRNPLSMGSGGYDSGTQRGATTGIKEIVVNGKVIDSPEAVAEQLEQSDFPGMVQEARDVEAQGETIVAELIAGEVEVQELFGMNFLKIPYSRRPNSSYGFQRFPSLRYNQYGYENYFMAYALFPDLIEKDFNLQADVAVKRNTLAARAIIEGGLPRLIRLDHDMADSRGTLVNVESLDRVWFPAFARSIEPFLKAGIRLIWHCDGNLMQMVPRLIEAGIGGFQGFQYEDGMDYVEICKMKDRNGGPLAIWGGVSVTTTLPMGSKEDVKKQLRWLVENGPEVGLMLGGSSSIAPSTNRENIRTLIEGLKYYRENGRGN